MPRIRQYQGIAAPVLPSSLTPETVTESRWHQPWSEPVRLKPGLHVSLQSFQPYDETQQFPETVTESRWHQPWSEPVRQKVGIQVTEHPLVSFDPFPFIKIDWFGGLSEPPVKAKQSVVWQQFIAQSESAQFPETVTESRWHQPWSEPVRIRPALGVPLQQTQAFVQVIAAATTVNVAFTGWGTIYRRVNIIGAG